MYAIRRLVSHFCLLSSLRLGRDLLYSQDVRNKMADTSVLIEWGTGEDCAAVAVPSVRQEINDRRQEYF